MGTKLGMIGLGNMGAHIGKRLLEHGYSLAVYDIRSEALERFREDGNAKICSSPAEVAAFADTVFVSLPSTTAIKEVVSGKNGLCSGAGFATYIDLSTTGYTVAVEVALQLAERGVAVLDAPVSGGVPGARAGTLSIMVSGSKEAYEAHVDVFNIIGNKRFYVGPRVGQAQVMKLANNYLSGVALVASSEALILGAKAGLEPQMMLDVLNASTGRNSATMDKFSNFVLNRKFNYGFKVGLMYKDIALCMNEADRMGVMMLLGNNVKELWKLMREQFGEEADQTEVVRMFENWTEIQIS